MKLSVKFIAFALQFVSLSVMAEGFGINSTRLIFPEGTKSITASMRNTLPHTPYLVHVTVDSTADGLNEKTPFSVVPPLFRLEPKGHNQVRIIGHPQGLPDDRESLFYFHAKAIPSSTPGDAGHKNVVNGGVRFGVGKVIKLFYRPSGLAMTSEDAQGRLIFSSVNAGVKVKNPTPYFISFADLTLRGKSLLVNDKGIMLAPFSEYVYPTAVNSGRIEWKAITDQGGVNAQHVMLN